MIGYFAMLCSIPVSISILIVELESFRSFIESNEHLGTWGKYVVDLLRRNFGDVITYHPFLKEENYIHMDEERSFENYDDLPVIRAAQKANMLMKENTYRVDVSLIENNENENSFCAILNGDMEMKQDTIEKNLELNRGNKSFEDLQISIDVLDEDEQEVKGIQDENKNSDAIRNLTNTYSSWHYFPPNK